MTTMLQLRGIAARESRLEAVKTELEIRAYKRALPSFHSKCLEFGRLVHIYQEPDENVATFANRLLAIAKTMASRGGYYAQKFIADVIPPTPPNMLT